MPYFISAIHQIFFLQTISQIRNKIDEIEEPDMKLHSSDLRRQCAVHRKREPCWICGRHTRITEAHHLVPLKQVAMYVNRYKLTTVKEPPIAWLCPNCHAYLHKFEMASEFRDEFEHDDEWHRLCDLFIRGYKLERQYNSEEAMWNV